MNDVCTYCGRVADSRDHVPPKNLFPKPRPNDLISVPSCIGCNQAFSKDDEYLRLVLTMRADTFDQAGANPLWPTVLRSLKRPEMRRFRQKFMASIRERDAFTQAGIYVGRVGTYDVDFTRLNRVASRIVSALFRQWQGERAPDTYGLAGYFVESLRNVDAERKRLLGGIVASVQQGPPTVVGNGIFKYWFRAVQETPHASVAAFVFYERIGCVGIVVENPNNGLQTNVQQDARP